jgi:NitT/TauT family transport system substrate-binding protein
VGRREFLLGAVLAGAGGLVELRPGDALAEAPPETTKLTLALTQSICQAPQYIAKGLLEGEGFTDVRYVESPGRVDAKGLATGQIQISLTFVGPLIVGLDAGDPVIMLGGGHIGCLELFGHDRVRAIRDLKGKTVAVPAIDGPPHIFLAIVMAHVGLDHRKDITLVARPMAEVTRMFQDGKVDAIVVSPPAAQELRAKKIGHVVVNSTTDRPWSPYFCCMIAGNRDFVRKHPIASKRAMRAILKSTDTCALEPDMAARTLVDQGFTNRHDYALQVMKEVPYRKWRDYDPADSVRFYALRMHESGMIKSSPQKILAEGTDWRFLNELKKELKG